MATCAGRLRFVPTAVLRTLLSRDVFCQIWRASERKLSERLVFWRNNGSFLKKQWQILNDRLNYCDVQTCERIINACCCPNNFMLDQMERSFVRVGRGAPMGNDGIWLDRDTVATEVTDATLLLQFAKRHLLLTKDACYWQSIFAFYLRRTPLM